MTTFFFRLKHTSPHFFLTSTYLYIMKPLRRQTECTCDFCGVIFLKAQSELKRNIILGRKNFCSRSCSAKGLQNFGDKRNTKPPQHGRLKDEYSNFREHMRRIRNRNKEYNVTVEYLKFVWDSQNGLCPYTGIKLSLRDYSGKNIDPMFLASIDRIDSNKGYIVGNIQWVSTPINYLKNNLTHNQVIDMCKKIQEFYNNQSQLL